MSDGLKGKAEKIEGTNKISNNRQIVRGNEGRVSYKYIENNKCNIKEDEKKRSTRELLIFRTQMCEQANRFDDMVEIMEELCRQCDDLTTNERNLLSCAYKNVIGSRRTSWRVLKEAMQAAEAASQSIMAATTTITSTVSSGIDKTTTTTTTIVPTTNGVVSTPPISNNHLILPKISIEHQNDRPTSANKSTHYSLSVIRAFLVQIESELCKHCGNIINILQTRLIPSNSATGESKVFYYKMKGDYMRYLCEISEPKERKERANESLMAYKAAYDKAIIELPPTHPVRLGLMLNFSVFYYEIMKSPERSCRMAKQAFDDAIAELDTLSEESYRDSTIIMQLLRDNLNLWESEQQQQVQNQTLTNNNGVIENRNKKMTANTPVTTTIFDGTTAHQVSQ